MLPHIKQEPIENPPDMKSQFIQTLPEIKSETIQYPPDLSPSKRPKTLTSHSPSKGKSKIGNEHDDDSDSDSSPQQQLGSCGVCLLEEGLSLRGFIDSCDHYFCFVCIMEWAKIESRCPICKRRFSTIRRPPKDGIFLSERIVNVPVRNQIYSYNGNATIEPSDPYSQVKCSVCSGSSDDHVLLLCDLCDSAAHSYCVGLGMTVPEGDWFCKDCTLSRDEHAKVETDTPSDNDNNNCPLSLNTERFNLSDVSIRDIVRESSSRELDASFVPTSVDQSESSREWLKTQSTVDQSNAAPNARTLQRCLNVHSRIRVLRENWDGFRRGSLNFCSSSEDGIKKSQSQSTSTNYESTSQSRPYDVDRAWKMMGIAAKALGKKPGNKKFVSQDLVFHKKKERLLNEASKVRPNSNYFGGLKKNESELSSSRKIIASAQVKIDHYKCQNLSAASNAVGSSEQSSSIATDKRCAKKVLDAALEKEENRKKTQFDGNIREIEDAKSEIQSLAQVKNGHYNCQNLLTASNAVVSSDQSSSIATDKRCGKEVVDAAVEKESIKKDMQFDGNIREIEEAKSEIQSLVKLNLKLLSKHNKLEADVFKEVARHATHSIMAACGIEPPKARFRSFERLVCGHSQTRKRPSSTLMPTCCRECFFVFVKDVVTTIAVGRTVSCKA